jgi:hypothetical protein
MANTSKPLREYGILPAAGEPFSLFQDDTDLKQHPCYQAAKAGNEQAAFILLKELALYFLTRIKGKLPKDVIFVAPFARESGGDNAIPQVLAVFCHSVFGGELGNDIVQVTRVFHTGADLMERLAMRPEFEGSVTPKQSYVLIDDVTNMGGTLAELANHIQKHGGVVAAIIVLVNAGRLKALAPNKVTIGKLERRYPDEIIELFHIKTAALTANEAQYLIGFKAADEIRNRLAKAKEEIHRRLRSKGIELTIDND